MNSKEALKDLRDVKGWNEVELNRRLDIIEKALKQAEKDKNILRLFKTIIGKRNKVFITKDLYDKIIDNIYE